MANDSVTLVLNGKVSLEDFSKALSAFTRLMNGLTDAVAEDTEVDWEITALEAGSAILTFQGRVVRGLDSVVPNVVRNYEIVTESFRQGVEPRNYPQTVVKPMRDLLKIVNGSITSVRFETEKTEAEISHASIALLDKPHRAVSVIEANPAPSTAFGSVRGRVQSMSNRQNLRFTLYDANADRPISCFMQPGSEDSMREAWGKLTIVEGLVRRDSHTGQPLTVRQVRNVIVLPEMERGSWRRAIGAVPLQSGMPRAEVVIRSGRE